LNVIRGLNDRFSDIDRHLRRRRPFPLLKDVVSKLSLEEMTLAHKAAALPTALVIATAKPSSTTPSGGAAAGHLTSASPRVVLALGALHPSPSNDGASNAAARTPATRPPRAALPTPPAA
jgi:hypothetical protein